jgi:flavodoxin/ferredoxin
MDSSTRDMDRKTIRTLGLFYFSGTGNTEIVAERIESAFRSQGVDVERIRIEDVLKGQVQVNTGAFDVIGIGHPVYGFDAPRIIDDFVHKLPPGKGTRTFVFKTAGDLSWLNNGASKAAIRSLERKGYSVFYERLICMPSNWAMRYADELSKQLCEAVGVKAEHTCAEILAGKERHIKATALFSVIVRWSHWGEELGACLFGKGLRVSRTCINCGTCIANCPTDNIHRHETGIQFGGNCLWCMRCIYACTRHAISPRFGRFCVLKGGYDIKSIIDDPSIGRDYIKPETRGYYARFVRYLQQPDV